MSKGGIIIFSNNSFFKIIGDDNVKKKGVLIGALSMFLAFSLASCQEGGNLVPPALGDIKIEGIEDALIDSNKLKMSFNVGNEVTSFDLNKVKADGATITFKDSKGNDVSGSYSLEVGTNRLTAIFKIGDEKIVYDLVITRNALERELLSIAVESLNNQYEVNSEFVAGKLKLSYSNNTSELIDLTLDMVSGFDTKTTGKKSLAIKYEGKECTYEIDVQEKVYKIASLNNRYLVGDEFSNGELLVKLFDNEEKIAITKDMVEGFDTTTPGKKTMTIKYDNKSFTYEYEVFLELLSVKSLKNEYIAGDTFTNGELSIKVGDKEEIVAITLDMVSGFDTSTPGEKTMTISYNNKSVEYKYVVYEELLSVKSLKNEYAINDEFTNGELIVKVNDKEEVIPLTLDMVSGFDTKTLGKKTLRIKYHKSELEYSYEVFDRELEIVEFKTRYAINSDFVPGKLKVKLGSTEEIVDITLDMVSGFDTTRVGSFDVVISYMGKEIKTAILVDKEENIYNSEVKNLLARVSVVQAILQGEPVDDINTFYNKKLEEILPQFDEASVKESADVLKSYNVTIDQLVAVSSLIDEEIVNAYTLYSKLDFENPDPLMEVI